MSLANLYEIPDTEEALLFWSFHNDAEHRKIVSAIKSQKGAFVDTFILDPIPLWDLPNWLRRHQQVHFEMNSALGQIGSDLSNVNLLDRDELIGWIELHAEEHRNVNILLGI